MEYLERLAATFCSVFHQRRVYSLVLPQPHCRQIPQFAPRASSNSRSQKQRGFSSLLKVPLRQMISFHLPARNLGCRPPRLAFAYMNESSPASSASDSAVVRSLVVEAVEAAAELMSRPSVGVAWDTPSALEGMSVGSLAAHLVRAAGATIAYLDRTPVDAQPEDDLLTPVTYFHAALDSPIHDQVKKVSADESAIGHEATATKCADLAIELSRRFADEPADRLVGALGGRMLTLDDFCRTRLIEVLLHLDDLSVSVGEPRPETDPLGVSIMIDIIGNIARHVHGDWKVIYALARSERISKTAVFPVF